MVFRPDTLWRTSRPQSNPRPACRGDDLWRLRQADTSTARHAGAIAAGPAASCAALFAFRTENGVTLDFAEYAEFRPQHFASLVSEAEFDAAKPRAAGRDQPPLRPPRVYFDDPDGHLFELITRPYGPIPQGG